MLLPVRGIGPWSVDMITHVPCAGRPDVLPVGDHLGCARGCSSASGLRLPRAGPDAAGVALPWQPATERGLVVL